MTLLIAQQDIAAGVAGVFGVFMCMAIAMALAQFVVFIIVLVQILQREMETDAKVLWIAVCWFLPVLGPILWWTIGSKQYPDLKGPRPPSP